MGLAYLPWPASDALRRILGAGFASYFRNSTLYYEEPVDLAKKVPASHVVLDTAIIPRRLSVLLYARGILPNRRASGACICCAVCVFGAKMSHYMRAGQGAAVCAPSRHFLHGVGHAVLPPRAERRAVLLLAGPLQVALLPPPLLHGALYTYIFIKRAQFRNKLGSGKQACIFKKICIVWWIMWVGEVLGTGLL